VSRTGLERHEYRAAPQPCHADAALGIGERVAFGVGFARSPVPAPTNHLVPGNDNRADWWIRAGSPDSPPPFDERFGHRRFVVHTIRVRRQSPVVQPANKPGITRR
jgi:hypothetical protein